MAKPIYSAITSLDGYIADEEGNFDWAVPDEEVHTFINDLERTIGTHLYGRRMYEVMVGWETDPTLAEQSPVMRDFAQIWQAADKIVYSKTLRGCYELAQKQLTNAENWGPTEDRTNGDIRISMRFSSRVHNTL
jgi:dihydrofolate reductase